MSPSELPKNSRLDASEEHGDSVSKDAPHQSRKRVWGCGCLATLCLILAAPVLWIYQSGGAGDFSRRKLEAEIRKSEADGLAVTLPTFLKKYGTTPAGEAAVHEAARITGLLRYDIAAHISTTATARAFRSSTSFDAAELICRETKRRPDTITTAALQAYVADNAGALDDLCRLPGLAPIEEIGWTHSFETLSPFEDLQRKGTKVFLALRESVRVLLPAAVHSALADGETTRAYALLTGWAHLNRAQKVGGTSFVSAVIGIAVDGPWLNVVEETLRTSPPADVDAAWRLYRMLDSERTARDYVQGCESEVVHFGRILAHAAGDELSDPGSADVLVRQIKDEARKEFWSAAESSWRRVLLGRRPKLPDFTLLQLAYPRQNRGRIYETRILQVEWLRRSANLVKADSGLEAEKQERDMEVWTNTRFQGNAFASKSIPGFVRGVHNARGVMAREGVLRAAVLMRIAELESSGTQTALPASLKEVFDRYGEAVPVDALADPAGALIEYLPDPATGTYTIRHAPNRKGAAGESPREFKAAWRPGPSGKER